jgi:hypothetical protein
MGAAMQDNTKETAELTHGQPAEGIGIQQQVRDALELMEFAVASGRDVPKRIIAEITKAGVHLRGEGSANTAQRAEFLQAYRDLAKFLKPITIRSLRDTSDAYGERRLRLLVLKPASQARIWSRKLWYWAIFFVLLALLGENVQTILSKFYPLNASASVNVQSWHKINSILQSIIPFTYGAIGALAFLLRSCHKHLRNREFDMNRVPEYVSRIILGIVAGGTISLFIQEVAGGTPTTTIRLSASALGFLAGYNNDFLFQAIERVSAAILPKVGLETARKAQPAPSAPPVMEVLAPVSIEKLIKLHEGTKDPETKKMLQNLIDGLTET